MNLTPRQKEVFDLIKGFVQEHGYAPTLQELADRLGVSTVTVFEHIGALVRKGVLRREKHKTRSIEIVEEEKEHAASVRLMGFIAAGNPIEAIEDEQRVDFSDLFGNTEKDGIYALRVRGNSMIEDQIRDGDYVIVENRSWARDGETVVALIEGQDATLKKIYHEDDRIRLQPANRTMGPIYVNDVTIQGVVIGMLRKY